MTPIYQQVFNKPFLVYASSWSLLIVIFILCEHRRLNAKAKVLRALAKDCLFTENCDLEAHNESDLVNCLSTSTRALRLFQFTENRSASVHDILLSESSIKIGRTTLSNVDTFTCLERFPTLSCNMDREISSQCILQYTMDTCLERNRYTINSMDHGRSVRSRCPDLSTVWLLNLDVSYIGSMSRCWTSFTSDVDHASEIIRTFMEG